MTALFLEFIMDTEKYITRQEIRERTRLPIETVRKLCIKNTQLSPIRIGNHIYYDRNAGEYFIEELNTTEKRSKSHKQPNEKDVWGVRQPKRVFVYSGKTLMHILFCQPALRNGRYSYQDCEDCK
jgi:hypothetical protein